jgi:hypothetical protein
MHCISIIRSLYFKIFSASFLITFLCPKIATSTCSRFVISDYNVWFVVGDGSISLYLLIPQYGYLTPFTCFY